VTALSLQVIRGDASPEDIASLLAVFAAVKGTAQPAGNAAIHAWNDRAATMRSFPAPGPGAWRASGLTQ
jgi:hypothetical protein